MPEAGVPDDIEFATKPAQAAEMVAAQGPRRRCPGQGDQDEVYGANAAFRTGLLRERGVGYVLAVAVDQHVTTGAGRGRVDALAAALPQRSWQPRGAGRAQGPHRLQDWAWVGIKTQGRRRG